MPRSSFHRLHWFHFQVDTKRDLISWYLLRMLRDVAYKLVGFFVPLWLFQIGKTMSWWGSQNLGEVQRGLIVMCAFYLVFRLTVLVVSLPVAKLFERWGYRGVLTIAQFGHAVALWLLSQSGQHSYYIWLAAMVEAVQFSCFWSANTYLIGTQTLKKRIGEDLGLVQFSLELMSLLAPALGGVIIVAWGFEELLWISLLLPIVGLSLVAHIKAQVKADHNHHDSWKEVKAAIKPAWFGLAFVGRYLHDAAMVLWPLYIFQILGGADRLGYLYSLSLFMSLVITLLAGVYFDQNKSHRPLFFSGSILSAVWLARTVIFHPLQLSLLEVLDRVTESFHWLCFDVTFFKHSRGHKALWFFAYKEVLLSLVAVCFWALLIAFFWWFGQWWQAIFVIAAVGVWGSVLIGRAWLHPVE